MRAYERLLNYVKVYTTSDPVSDTHPTTARQFDLARMLVKELQDIQKRVTVIDSDAARCQEMSEKFPGVLVIHGDGADAELLSEERITDMDAFVALTGLD